MKMSAGDVFRFMMACDQLPVKDAEDQLKMTKLYRELIEEEYTELQDAIAAHDRVEEFDACLDLIWILIGHCHAQGWDLIGGWNEVARSNMAKIDPATGKMNRRADGKVTKPEGWTPPDLLPYMKESV